MTENSNEKEWNDGRLIEIKPGESLSAKGLTSGQLYAVMLYNVAQNDNTAVLTVRQGTFGSRSVQVPGTTQGRGGAGSAYFLATDQSHSVDVNFPNSINSNHGKIQAILGSVAMPTNFDGIKNEEIKVGEKKNFERFARFWFTPPAENLCATVAADRRMFQATRFYQKGLTHYADVYVMNKPADFDMINQVAVLPSAGGKYDETGQNKELRVKLRTSTGDRVSSTFFNGGQNVFFNMDSAANSKYAWLAIDKG
ncbi:hypothetical protein SAMN04487905_11084 [Actinopolyspora xinjiangensis]|uniref:Uncharacterized protein n=2 Tax=Actinopolyspora xinjiangensis TaxID=405564 RepID=A0A1H0W0D2_9ACTN|nr:hypothetical protein SAMN04487905_11084 [Actinopolyspora xinjiangensis]